MNWKIKPFKNGDVSSAAHTYTHTRMHACTHPTHPILSLLSLVSERKMTKLKTTLLSIDPMER